MRLILAAASALALAACTTTGPTTSAPLPPDETPIAAPGEQGADTCNKAAYAHLVGMDADAIDRASLPVRTRIVMPDTMLTREYIATRLNLMIGTDGRVGSLACF